MKVFSALGAALVGCLAFCDTAESIVLFEQTQAMQSSGFNTNQNHTFDDFRVDHDAIATGMTIWQLEEGTWDNNLQYYIHKDASGVPTLDLVNGELLNSYAAGNATNVVRELTGRTPPIGPEYKLTFDFASPVFLEAGQTYWIGLHGHSADNNHSGGIFWTAVVPGFASNPVRVGFSAGTPVWLAYFFGGDRFGLAFEIHGDLVPPFLKGDYNGNGLVEHGDLDLVLVHWGETYAPEILGWTGEPGTGIVDQDELDRVLGNWGDTTGLVTAGVPEPYALALLGVLVAPWLVRWSTQWAGSGNAQEATEDSGNAIIKRLGSRTARGTRCG